MRALLVPNRHDPGPKTILGQTANFDADSYADLLVAQPAHATHLAQRLWYRFAGATIRPRRRHAWSRRTGPATTSAHCSRRVLRDPEFPTMRGQLVKQPVEWVVGALRQLEVRPSAFTDAQRRQLLGGLDGLGQVPLQPPSVGGWPANAAWLTTASLQVRLRLAAGLAAAASPAIVDSLLAARRTRGWPRSGACSWSTGGPTGPGPHCSRPPATRGGCSRSAWPVPSTRSAEETTVDTLTRRKFLIASGVVGAAARSPPERPRSRWRTSSPRPMIRAGRPATVPSWW